MTKPIILTAVGDVSFGDTPKCLGFGVKSKVQAQGADFIFDKIQQHLSGDIIFGNLEVVLSNEGLLQYDFISEQLRGRPSCVTALTRAGFNVMNIANNHSMQHGEEAFLETTLLLNENGIIVVGLKGVDNYKSTLEVINVNDKSIGFLGYSFEIDAYSPSSNVRYACSVLPEEIMADIRNAKKTVDWLIVSAHWGLEFIDHPSLTTVRMGRNFIDAGADIILGHHPHVVQGIETYKNKIICYSLGNFVFDMAWSKTCKKSMIVQFQLNHDKSIEYEIIPVQINKNYQPEHTPSEKNDFLRYFNKLQRKLVDINAPIDTEKYNLEYYKSCQRIHLKYSLLSNFFFLLGVFRTPPKFIPGKLKNMLSKVINIVL